MLSSYKEFKNFIQKLNTKPSLLLHSCCAPCSSHTILVLKEYFDLTIYYSNDNIHPYEEYKIRLDEQINFATNFDINVLYDEYDDGCFFRQVKGLESLGEHSNRCYECYKLRLEKTAKKALELGFDYFSTTLSISPYKNSKWINEIGYMLEEKYNIKYLFSDFKKEEGYKHSIELSKYYDLYRQDYCGCVFSFDEAFRRKFKKEKETVIKHLNVSSNNRLIFISDIHSDVDLFKKALSDINFNDDDYLFIIGDMIEKGEFLDNKKMLDYVIELNKKENVFCMAGNCDEVLRFVIPPIDKKIFLNYALKKKYSIINDLAHNLNITITEDIDCDDFARKIYLKYPQYYEFINDLTDVIFINDKLVLVHGGIMDINNIPSKALDVLKHDYFYLDSAKQEKIMIVGHFPARNYRDNENNVNPILDFNKNIICIDGGNQIVAGGQINVLMLDSIDDLNFYFKAYDHYPKYIMEEDVIYQNGKINNIMFGHNEVSIIKENQDYYLLNHLSSNSNLWVHKDFVYLVNDKYYCYDGSNQFMNLKKGDKVSVIKVGKPYCLIKHNGCIGLIESKYIHEERIFD